MHGKDPVVTAAVSDVAGGEESRGADSGELQPGNVTSATRAIAAVETGAQDRPIQDVVIESISISRD